MERIVHRQLAYWLFTLAGFTAVILLVGGLTRLTDSGLSITEWQVISGILPPLSDAAWQTAFTKYQAIPEYQLINRDMNLAEFKIIYWWEWTHRALARIIALVFIVPLVIFTIRRRIPSWLWMPLTGLLILGMIQGVVGWYMVQSGLVARVDVSHYRLAVHLGLAVIIFGWSFWLALTLWRGRAGRGRFLLRLVSVLVFVQILSGALVAGLDAGRIYTDWPRINGALIPDGLLQMNPYYLNFFENRLTVQFNHRLLAYLLVLLIIYEAIIRPRLRMMVICLLVIAQIALGIAVLHWHVPLVLASLHQLGALILLSALLNDMHKTE